MKAVNFDGDLIVGTATGPVPGVDLPKGVPVERLRVVLGEFVDIAERTQFWIDDVGQKHVTKANDAWQSVTCAWDATLVKDGSVWRERLAVDELSEAKRRGRAMLATAAETQRQKYITTGDGKAAVYSIKREEVRRYQAPGKAVVASDFPWMDARAKRLGVPLQTVADEWAAKVQAWETVGRAIENAYEAAVEAIDALSNAATVEADIARIVEGVRWP